MQQDVKMKEAQAIIKKAQDEGRTSLSEYESKNLIRVYGIPTTREVLVDRLEDLPKALDEIGYPLVIKGCSPHIAHAKVRLPE